MRILITICLLLSTPVFALTVSSDWTAEFKKVVTVNCSEDDGYQCANLCEDYDKCEVNEGYCRNCAGDNQFIKYIFREMGNRIQSYAAPVNMTFFIDFIGEGNFVSLTSKSIFNFIDKYNSFSTKEKFRSLCPSPTEYPIVFLEVNPVSRDAERIKYVACSNSESEAEIYNLKKIFDVEVN